MSPQAYVDPDEMDRFTGELKEFYTHISENNYRLIGQFTQLKETWKDQEQQKFAHEFEVTMKTVHGFLMSVETEIPFLRRKAQRAREYLEQNISIHISNATAHATTYGDYSESAQKPANNSEATTPEPSQNPAEKVKTTAQEAFQSEENKAACDKLVKTVATKLGIVLPWEGDNADGIIVYMKNHKESWEKIDQNKAIERAKQGAFVVAAERGCDMIIPENSSHVAVLIPGTNDGGYPLCIAGSINYPQSTRGMSDGNLGINYIFPKEDAHKNMVSYYVYTQP